MQSFLTPLTIFLATCAGFLVGSLWYSPILFMKAWLMGEGLTKDLIPKRGAKYMLQINFYSFIAHGAMATVLAVLFEVMSVTSLTIAISLGLLVTFGFIVTTRFIDMIYTTHGKHFEMRSQIKFLVSSGYYLLTVAVMSLVLFIVGNH